MHIDYSSCIHAHPVHTKQKGFRAKTREALIFMELAMGFEPATC